jgi:hypothetical protein
MRNAIIITNRFLEATEPTQDDHYKCDVNSQECLIGDPAPHLRLAAIARGQKIKSGIKVSDLTLDEVKALAQECADQVYFSGATHLQEDFKYHYNIHYSLKRFYERLIKLQNQMEETK